MHYNKAPITEAILDLRVILPEGATLEKFQEICFLVQDKFPIVEPLYPGTGEISFKPGEVIATGTSVQQIGVKCTSKDNLQVFQATFEGFTFNQIAPYESWENFSSEARRCWNLYKSICQPTHVTQVGIRYINQINIPSNNLIELKDYLKTAPEISSEMPQKILQTFFMQLQIPQQDLNCMLIINEAIAPPKHPEYITLILDIDLFRQQVWDSNDDEIWHLLEMLRYRKNEVFEASITNRTRELMN